MRNLNHWIAILLIAVFTIVFSGWMLSEGHSTHAFPAAARVSLPAASGANPSAAAYSEPTPFHPSRRPAHDSEFAVYRNVDYGISFRYPRNYALVEGTSTDDLKLLRYQEELAAEQPDAVPVATVIIPEDAYPNTSFRSGALQFVAHRGVTPEACRAYVSADASEDGSSGTKGTITIQGIPFDWRLDREGDADAFLERAEYAGYSGGTCYEFVLEIAASNATEPESEVKPADIPKIFRPLEKIVLSFQVHPSAPKN